MTDLGIFAQTLAFGMIGWQELLILLVCPASIIGIVLLVLLVLYLTGVIGKRKQ